MQAHDNQEEFLTPISSPSSLTVSKLQLDRTLVNTKTIGDMADAATASGIAGGPTADQWNELKDRVVKTDTLSDADLATLQAFQKTSKPVHSQLHNEFSTNNGSLDPTKTAQLEDVHVYLAGFDNLNTALKVAGAKTAVAAVAGAGFGALNVVSAFEAYANLGDGALKDMVQGLEDVQNGKSNIAFSGNKVENVDGPEVWQKYNQMLDGGIESVKAGKPVPINDQHFELTSPVIVGKLADNAAAGNKVRVSVDLGRVVVFGNKGPIDLDETPDKLRAALQLMNCKGDVGVSGFPVKKLLGDANDLMHRKSLQVGDQVLLTGCNANSGSGENFDAGFVIEGPAAQKLGNDFKTDLSNSVGATNDDVWNQKALDALPNQECHMGSRGLCSMIDAITGPAPAGTDFPHPKSFAEMDAWAKSKGIDVASFIDLPADQVEAAVNASLTSEHGGVTLSAAGKQAFLGLLNKTMDKIGSAKNQDALKDVGVPDGSRKGDVVVSVSNQPVEREVLLLEAIQDAKSFIDVPAFVMTKPIAAAIVARRDELVAEGKPFAIRMVIDSGIYPDGGTPNAAGVRYLEDHGVTPRWAILPLSGMHTRKVHAKVIETDQGKLAGSTNFSIKGLQDNWEHSGYVHYQEGDANSQAIEDSSKKSFNELFDNESFECNTKEVATLSNENYTGKDKDTQIEESRDGVVKTILHSVQNYQNATGVFVQAQASDPTVQARVTALVASGMDEGDATLQAVSEKMGPEKFLDGLHALPEYQTLQQLKPPT
jgi:phosphatidylserine/phosphatidylglycerophosphate/cardiolipin synthase-like enzyme